MKDVVVVGGVRTGMGSLGGAMRDIPAQTLQQLVFQELFARHPEVPLEQLDEVIVACIGQSSDAPNMGRVSAIRAGVPQRVPASTIAMNCASSLKAVAMAYQAIQAGDGDLFLIGGVESMSTYPYLLRQARFGYRLNHGQLTDVLWEGLTCPLAGQLMGRTAENLAEEFGISREEQDRYAVASHKKAFRAMREGRLKDEIVTVMVPKKMAGREVAPEPFAQDENVNIGLTQQMLALYPTIFKDDGSVTPGNACPISDAGAACFVMSAEKAAELSLEPLLRIRSYAFAGLEPERMGLGPAYATPLALKKAGMEIQDIDLIELNEAFAVQVLACFKAFPFPQDRVNLDGGAVAMGHPVGFTGLRMLITLGYKLRQRELSTGLATLCVGGGQGGAMIVERV